MHVAPTVFKASPVRDHCKASCCSNLRHIRLSAVVVIDPSVVSCGGGGGEEEERRSRWSQSRMATPLLVGRCRRKRLLAVTLACTDSNCILLKSTTESSRLVFLLRIQHGTGWTETVFVLAAWLEKKAMKRLWTQRCSNCGKTFGHYRQLKLWPMTQNWIVDRWRFCDVTTSQSGDVSVPSDIAVVL